jgi:hypothetical protein
VKERYLNDIQSRIRLLAEIRDKYNDSSNNTHLYKLLSSYGNRLGTR